MLQIVISTSQKPVSTIRKMIAQREIDTWAGCKMSNGHDRLCWTGGQQNNWEALDETVYFEARSIARDSDTNYIKFYLHTQKGHYLSEADYAQMHSELMYMLLAHIYDMIMSCEVMKSINAKYKADIIDE